MRPTKAIRPKFWLAKVLCGGLLLALFTYSVVDYETFEGAAQHVKGKVLSVKRETHATGRRGGKVTIERPFVKFTVPQSNQELEATAKVLSSHEFHPGDEVDLEFDPTRPSDTVRVASGMPLPDVAFGVVGLALFGFGAAERWRWRRLAKVATPPVARGQTA